MSIAFQCQVHVGTMQLCLLICVVLCAVLLPQPGCVVVSQPTDVNNAVVTWSTDDVHAAQWWEARQASAAMMEAWSTVTVSPAGQAAVEAAAQTAVETAEQPSAMDIVCARYNEIAVLGNLTSIWQHPMQATVSMNDVAMAWSKAGSER